MSGRNGNTLAALLIKHGWKCYRGRSEGEFSADHPDMAAGLLPGCFHQIWFTVDGDRQIIAIFHRQGSKNTGNENNRKITWPKTLDIIKETPEMTEENQVETDTQRAMRSALGGFDRDFKTFEGHWGKIQLSAANAIKRHAKFALQEPGHPRLAETAELLAQAKRIIGQGVSEPETDGAALAEAVDQEQLAGIEGAVMMLARLALADDGLGASDADDARSYLRNWLGHLAPLPKCEPAAEPDGGGTVASMDAQAGVPGYADVPGATGNFADWNENARPGPLAPGDVVTGAHFGGQAPDPAAGLIAREQERVQAVLDAAAAKANPLAAALAPAAVPVNPFAGWPAPGA